MATRLFVGNLPKNTVENDLRSAFSDFGEIINFDLKSKCTTEDETKKFAFVTISGSNYDIESCIKHFSNEHFNGNRLYVTRARESFLERLERERVQAKEKDAHKADAHGAIKKTPVLKLGDKLNPRKRKIDETHINQKVPKHNKILGNNAKQNNVDNNTHINNDLQLLKKRDDSPSAVVLDAMKDKHQDDTQTYRKSVKYGDEVDSVRKGNVLDMYKKKLNSEIQRMEAIKKMRQDFKEKKNIVKIGLTSVDKVSNKRIVFSDYEYNTRKELDEHVVKSVKKNKLFEDENEDSGDELNFKIKEQYEGKKGLKVLDLQSRYKSDKRFVLDERFIEDDGGEDEEDQNKPEEEDQIEVSHTDEKDKQLNILQDLLGVAIKRKIPDDEKDGKKNKHKIGMLRFDPSQPEHAKFLAPVDTKLESTKKSKKRTKDKQVDTEVEEQRQEEPRPEVSKEQFYKVSDTLKEAIAQPTSFSLRSLFGNAEVAEDESKEEAASYIPLEPPKKSKVKNPLEPGEKNPFVYDSSDSETEDVEKETKTETKPVVTESKAVWKENFFFGMPDQRFEEGLAFFNNANDDVQKERRELKSLMKKRIYNKERKTQMQMFQKKIGGRKKTMKKSFRRKN